MVIDWIHFSPERGLLGGLLIGLAAAILLLGCGRIAGISGILSELPGVATRCLAHWRRSHRPSRMKDATGKAPENGASENGAGEGKDNGVWRAAFLAGLITPALLLTVSGRTDGYAPNISLTTGIDWGLWIGAGLLVGFGTRLANGCTSGHGVCGLARFSLRSLVAVACFMGAAMATVWLARHGPSGFVGHVGYMGFIEYIKLGGLEDPVAPVISLGFGGGMW